MRRILTFAVLAAALPTAAAAAVPWKITQVSGQVQLIDHGKVKNATAGAVLPAGAAVSTGAHGRAVLVRGQEFIVVSPGSQLLVPEKKDQGGLVQIIQQFGSALFRIEKKSTPHFAVKTRYLVAVVKGTTFEVDASGNRASVLVSEGAVQVSTNDHSSSMLLTPGQQASVDSAAGSQISLRGNPASWDWPSAKSDKAFEWSAVPGRLGTLLSGQGQILLIFLLTTVIVGLGVANFRLRRRQS